MANRDPKAFAQAAPAEHPPHLWWKGEVIPWESATVHLTQVGWTAISAVFEGIRAYWDLQREELNVFRLDAHLKRFAQSMRFMRMEQTYSSQQLTEAVTALMRANGYREDAYCQPLAYLGRSVPGYLAADNVPSEVFITTRAAPSNLKSDRVSSAGVSSWTRIPDNVMPPRAKAITNYQNSRYVSNEARINGYDVGIILNSQGQVAEGAYACIFIIRDGVAATPSKTAGILESITRDSLIDLLKKRRASVEERDVDRTELYYAEEVFLCGTLAEIEVIGSVDRYQVGDGGIGPITRELEARFERAVRGRDPRRAGWLTPVYARAGARTG